MSLVAFPTNSITSRFKGSTRDERATEVGGKLALHLEGKPVLPPRTQEKEVCRQRSERLSQLLPRGVVKDGESIAHFGKMEVTANLNKQFSQVEE